MSSSTRIAHGSRQARRRLFSLSVLAAVGALAFACGGVASNPVGDGGGSGSGSSSGGGSGSGGGGGSGSSSGGWSGSSSGSIPGCPPSVHPIPSAPVYECALVPGATSGCGPWSPPNAPPGKGPADAGGLYPINCNVYVPEPQGGCAGNCCGAQVCLCAPPLFDAGTGSFVCPV